MSWRMNETAAVEITAFAAGAGPPEKRIATRLIGRVVVGVVELDTGVSLSRLVEPMN